MQGRAPRTAGAAASDGAAGYLAVERRCVITGGGSGMHYRCRQQATACFGTWDQGKPSAVPQPQYWLPPDVYRIAVEIDVSVAGQSWTYVFNCVRDGQFTVIQPLGMR
jgi:hypothetical protein